MLSGRNPASGMRGRVRAPRRMPTPAADEFARQWHTLQEAFVAIHTKKSSKLSFEQLYRTAYNAVLQKKGEQLYDNVSAFEEAWFTDHVMPEIASLLCSKTFASAYLGYEQPQSAESATQRRIAGETFLRGLRAKWEAHNEAMNMISDILMYLDRGYIEYTRRPSIFAKTIGLFRDHVLMSTMVGSGSLSGGGAGGGDVLREDRRLYSVLNSVLFDQIRMERQGDMIDKSLVRECVYILEALYETDEEKESERLYLTLFEPDYIAETRLFYREECERLLREGDAGAWLRQTKRRLGEEQDRCMTTVSHLSLQKVVEVIEEELISRRMDDFLALEQTGINAMLDNDRIEDLSILYELVGRVDQTKKALLQPLNDRVIALGSAIQETLNNTDFSTAPAAAAAAAAAGADGAAEGAADEGEGGSKAQTLSPAAQQTLAAIRWVDDVLRLKDKFDVIVSRAFEDDVILSSALTRGFSDFVNRFPRAPEFISLFIDDNLKRGIRGKTEAEVDAVLEKAITLIRFIKDKDMLERYYQKHLARRLLHNKSESTEAEQLMISRMKLEVGNDFTRKFEGMFKDIVLSGELNDNFGRYRKELGDDDSTAAKIDFSIILLSTNRWPVEVWGSKNRNSDNLVGEQAANWPEEIRRLQASFNNFYQKNSTGRVLTWPAAAGNADVRAVFPRIPGKESGPLSRERRYELHMSSAAMIVVMLFADTREDEQLSYAEIQAKTSLPELELTRALSSLSLPAKCRILLKDPLTRFVEPTDKFSFNARFVSKTVKVRIPNVSLASRIEDRAEREETQKKADTTRSYLIDASIVRIMKQRRELSHTALVTEVIAQVSAHFQPDVALIKRRIEDLISREYLERKDGAAVPTYTYLA